MKERMELVAGPISEILGTTRDPLRLFFDVQLILTKGDKRKDRSAGVGVAAMAKSNAEETLMVGGDEEREKRERERGIRRMRE